MLETEAGSCLRARDSTAKANGVTRWAGSPPAAPYPPSPWMTHRALGSRPRPPARPSFELAYCQSPARAHKPRRTQGSAHRAARAGVVLLLILAWWGGGTGLLLLLMSLLLSSLCLLAAWSSRLVGSMLAAAGASAALVGAAEAAMEALCMHETDVKTRPWHWPRAAAQHSTNDDHRQVAVGSLN
jgi:hypothetical protein